MQVIMYVFRVILLSMYIHQVVLLRRRTLAPVRWHHFTSIDVPLIWHVYVLSLRSYFEYYIVRRGAGRLELDTLITPP